MERKPLVLIGGKLSELPSTDTLSGVLFRKVDSLWVAQPFSIPYVSGMEKVVINGANFISKGGDSVWPGFSNGYGRYSLYIGQEAADNFTEIGTFDVNLGVGYAVFKDSVSLESFTALGGGAARQITRDEAPETGSAGAQGVAIGTSAGRNILKWNDSVVIGAYAAQNVYRILRSTLIGNSIFYQTAQNAADNIYKVTAVGSNIGRGSVGEFRHIVAMGHENLLGANGASNSILLGDYIGMNSVGLNRAIIIGHYRDYPNSVQQLTGQLTDIISIGHFVQAQEANTINFPLAYRLLLGTTAAANFKAVINSTASETGGNTRLSHSGTTILEVLTDGKVSIGSASANPSAQVEVNSTSKGVLPPRMTTAQKEAIVSPATGLMVFDTDLGTLQEYNGVLWAAPNSKVIEKSVTTASYIPILSDYNKKVNLNDVSGVSLVFDTNANVPFPVGTVITFKQAGAGQITASGAVGVTVYAPGGKLKTAEQDAIIQAEQESVDVWLIIGGVA